MNHRGVSICILTYNVLFYNRLALDKIRELTRVANYEIFIYDNGSNDGSAEFLEKQPDVTLFKGKGNGLSHGQALDFLVQRANFPITCTLCSDAFPVSCEWLTPAFYLNEVTFLAGVHRFKKGRLGEYVCPSYLFGWTEWLKRKTFKDNYPKWDTGELLGKNIRDEGLNMKTWHASPVEFPGLPNCKPKKCDYNGWVWHTAWTGRRDTSPWVIGKEVEADYHAHVKNVLRKRFNLEY